MDTNLIPKSDRASLTTFAGSAGTGSALFAGAGTATAFQNVTSAGAGFGD